MSLFAAFLVPSEELLLHETFRQLPEVDIEIERVVATDELVTPYFWMIGTDASTFEEVATSDGSIEELQRLDSFDEGTLYRTDWTEHNEVLLYAYTELGTTVLEATGQDGQWELRIRFDDREQLTRLRDYLHEHDFEFTLAELHEVTDPRSPGQYGLSEKQEEALVAAWEIGYYDTPREITLTAIADELDISEQALSNRLRRGYDRLIANALRVTPPDD